VQEKVSEENITKTHRYMIFAELTENGGINERHPLVTGNNLTNTVR